MTTMLVGVDTGDRSDDAIALARELATRTGAGILLAYAVPYPVLALVGDGVAGVVAPEVVEQAQAEVATKAQPLRDAGLDVDVVTRPFVSPPHFLQSIAEEHGADLIVVGSTHTSRWGRVVPGSTGERLLHGAPCPVAVAPAGYATHAQRGLKRIGVAFEGSDESRAALRAAVALAGSLGARLDVITVLDVADFAAPALMNGPGYGRTRDALEARARVHLEAVVAELPAAVQPSSCLLVGDPAQQLAEATATRDLMLAGSRGYGPLRAVLLGGVSGRLARHAACPLVITPRGVDSPLRTLAGRAATGASEP